MTLRPIARGTGTTVLFAVVVTLISAAGRSVANPEAEETWYKSPTLGIMTGFIYEPLKPYTIQEWEKGLGNRLDADCWVADFKEAGASYLIFYDKWIDGFVFHDTKTTGFKTSRDFVRQISEACHRGNLQLIYYFNAVSDGNPEFDKWATNDRQGEPIVFSPNWPTRYQTLHSPFRSTSVEQLRELLTNYDRVDGIWLDIFGERLNTTSPWVGRGFEKMYGEPFDQADGGALAEFNARTLAAYLDDVQAIAEKHQPNCVWTSNGSASNMLRSGVWDKWVGTRLDHGSNEGHDFGRMDQLARTAWINPKPMEIGLLLCSSWFTPMEDRAPPAVMTERQAIACAAVAVCQGASVYMALTPGHSGVFGEDLQRAKAVGAWFTNVEPLLKDARPYADVGIVLGTPATGNAGLPSRNTLWKRYYPKQMGALDEAAAIRDALERAGVFSQLLYASPQGVGWPDSLSSYRAIVLPEQAVLDQTYAEDLRQYVRQGGQLIAFGHASMLDAHSQRRDRYALNDVFGVTYRGESRVVTKGRALPANATTDSEYSSDFAADHLVDGLPTAWASGGTPMPHWAEIILPEAVDAATVELVNRQGPYQVADVDIEARVEGNWKLVASIRGAKNRVISAKLDSPVHTQAVRVTVLRELFQGKDRQYADAEAIRILDTAGRDRSTSRSATIPLVGTTEDLRRDLGAESIGFFPMALDVEPTSAEVIATLDHKNGPPAILRNRCGNGEAILITTTEGTFRTQDAFWTALRRLVIGRPTLSCEGRARDRYRFIMTRTGSKHVLHVIDPVADGPRFQAMEVTVALEPMRFGGLHDVRLAGAAEPIPVLTEDGLFTFVVRPDPVATVVLR